MKLTIKIALVISLFCTTAFADGDMSNGGKNVVTNTDGDMSNGGRTIVSNNDQDESENYILNFVQNFLNEIFG